MGLVLRGGTALAGAHPTVAAFSLTAIRGGGLWKNPARRTGRGAAMYRNFSYTVSGRDRHMDFFIIPHKFNVMLKADCFLPFP
jgi:hypothetical protein